MYPTLSAGLCYFPNKQHPIGVMARVLACDRERKMISKVFYFAHIETDPPRGKDQKIPRKVIRATIKLASDYRKMVSLQEWGKIQRPYRQGTITGAPIRKGREMPLGQGNTSGIVGVRHVMQEVKLLSGGVTVRRAWVATWTQSGRAKAKWFGYGGVRAREETSDSAKAKAIAYRAEMVKLHYSPVPLL